MTTPYDDAIEEYESGAANDSVPAWVANELVWNKPKKGTPTVVPNLANAVTILERDEAFAGLLAFDEFAQTIVARGALPFERRTGEPWSDADDYQITIWLQQTYPYRLKIGADVARQAVFVVANRYRFNSLTEDLQRKARQWDGEPRLDTWLSAYLGVQETEYSRAVGAAWLLAGAARGLFPGCKADNALILEGAQGAKKSTTFQILGGARYTDEIADFGSKDAAMQLQGVHVLELAELDGMNRADVSRTKAWMTKTFDRFVPKYGKHAVKVSRQCIIAGTVNNNTYLRDETGGRRFWPVEVTDVRTEELRADADQLWGEAAHRVQQGERWWLDDRATIELARDEQASRTIGDPWDGTVETFVAGRPSVGLTEVLEHLFRDDYGNAQVTKWGQVEMNRVARTLSRLGWERRRENAKDAAGHRSWRYYPPRPSTTGACPSIDEQLGHAEPLVSPSRPTVPVCLSKEEEETGRLLWWGSNAGGIYSGPTGPTGTTGTLGQPDPVEAAEREAIEAAE